MTSAEGVTGPYDVVALAEARNLDELGRRVMSSIQALEGVIRTLPCAVVRLQPSGPPAGRVSRRAPEFGAKDPIHGGVTVSAERREAWSASVLPSFKEVFLHVDR